MEIIMLDQPIQAHKAVELGLVSQAVSSNTLTENTHALARNVAKMPIDTLGRMKQLMNQSFYNTLTEQLAAERQAIALSANSPEGREGLSAFLQKRSPVFAGKT
jgi:2-(1,2-epoxy-1,2-dihydrophenyl)acetyl-CoA isomerase